MTTMTPRVVDISHHNTGTLPKGAVGFGAMSAAGIWGLIHKSSQGRAYVDPDYAHRRREATAAGLLWGAYHFNTGDDVLKQVDNFMQAAQPDEKTCMVLDFEDNRPSQMSMSQAVAFMGELDHRLGRPCAIYSGNRLKEHLGDVGPADRSFLAKHRLWLCQYGPRAIVPPGWSSYWLWQYTGDGIGLPPHEIAGMRDKGIDLNVYDHDQDQLAREWA